MQYLVRDGVRLAYTEAGHGEPPLLFIHGWCCDHRYLQPQFEHFQINHRVVGIDLRGHGSSDKPLQDYTVTGFADDTAWLADRLGLRHVVAIGHSMGGVIATELAVRRPDLVAAVIALDTTLVWPPEARVMLAEIIPTFFAPDYRDFADEFVKGLFLPTDDPLLKARVVADMTSAPQHVMAPAARDMLTRDDAAIAAACTCPLLTIYAGAPGADVPRLRELCPQVAVECTPGVGHFNPLLAADQINAMIEPFLLTI